jgi:carboxymethylenebutenolidase
MCFDLDSAPPVPVLRGAAVSHEEVVLEAADGNRFAALHATPDEPGGNCVIILPDVRGLSRFYEELALRFAERGIAAITIDYFGRTAGVGKREDDFPYVEHVERLGGAQIQLDVAAAVERLRSSGCRAIFTVGFCLGGRHSWLAAAEQDGLVGAVGFYGRPSVGRDGSPGPTQRASELRAPILGLMGGADAGIPAEDVAAFGRALETTGVEHELVTYDGAPHSFFDRKQEEFAEASDDAWRRTLEFVERYGT